MIRIATIGATLSGNKGAAAMLESVLDNLPLLLDDDAQFEVLSIYPNDDPRRNRWPNVEVVPAPPRVLVLAVPLAFLWTAFRALHLPGAPFKRNRLLRTLQRSDMLIDLSGISFSDGRTIELFYNVACVLPALVLGKRVVKYSQAMGPFETTLNRALAKIVLPHLTLNIARGKRTLGHLRELGVQNIALCADAAFALRCPEATHVTEDTHISTVDSGRRLIGIAVSSVLCAYCARRGKDYCRVLAQFADGAVEQGYDIALIAHAVKESKPGGRTDDVAACRAVYAAMLNTDHCELITDDYPAATLRLIVGACDFIIASRFHAMVSALAMGVPILVTSWSHKYAEVLEMFDLAEWTIGYQALSTAALCCAFRELEDREEEVRKKIARHLPAVVRSSERNAELVAQLLRT